MVLVLGRPGAGCSTLLRVLANDTKNYKQVTGRLTFGPFTSDEIIKHHRGEVLYNQEGKHKHKKTCLRKPRFVTRVSGVNPNGPT